MTHFLCHSKRCHAERSRSEAKRNSGAVEASLPYNNCRGRRFLVLSSLRPAQLRQCRYNLRRPLHQLIVAQSSVLGLELHAQQH